MHRIVIAAFCFSPAWGQPVPLIVANAAKPFSVRMEARVAPGSLIDVSIQPRPQSEPRWFDPTFTLFMQLSGSDDLVPVPVVQAISPASIRARVPEQAPIGIATFILRIGEVEVARSPVRIVPADPGIFTLGGDGLGPAIAQQVGFGRVQKNGLALPARPGDHVVLWATGLGSGRTADVKATLGDEMVEVLYAGPAPGLAGVDQINLRLPQSSVSSDDCYLPLRLSTFGEPANFVTLSKTADGSPCAHPLNLSVAQMNELDAGGTVPVGSIGVYSLIGPPPRAAKPRWDVVTRMDHADANFMHMNAATVARIAGFRMPSQPSGQCSGDSALSTVVFGLIGGGATAPVSVGDRIRLSRGGQSVDLMPPSPEFVTSYAFAAPQPAPRPSPIQLPPSMWTPGVWTIDAPGTDVAGPLHATVDVTPAIEITNPEAVSTIDRSKDLSIEWNGQGYGAASTVTVVLGGSRTALVNPFFDSTSSYTVTCTADARAGRIVIPASILREFDAIQATADSAAVLNVSLQNTPRLYLLPHKNGDPVPTRIVMSSGELMGVSIR